MDLIQQFPDVSQQMRDRAKWNQKSRQAKRMSMRHMKDNDPGLVLFYDNEFKKWHCKVALIIALGIACLYGVIFKVSGIFQWILTDGNFYNI